MRKTHSAMAALRFCAQVAALTGTAILLPTPALAASGTGMAAHTASAPLLVLTRGNVRMAPAVLSSMSKKAGMPLLLTRSIGTGAYLVRPARPTTAQGLHTIAGRLATHPNVLGAQIYKQSAPAYMLAPAGHRVTLDGARLAGSTTPIVSYRWHQILGPNTGIANAARPNVSFLARQAATPGGSTSDPTAINPGDLTAPPQQLQCAISAASARRTHISSPVLISKNTFMCDTGNGSAPAAGTTPPDSGTPGAGTPPADTETPGAGTPVDSGNPGAGSPPVDTGYPSPGTPSDSYVPPAGFNTPTPASGSPSGGPGLMLCSGECSNATLVPGGNCSGDCSGARYNGTPTTPGSLCSGDCHGAQGGGNCSGECSNISANSVRAATVRKNVVSRAPVIGYRLIATDKTGVAHVRNIYIRVQPQQTSTASPAKATARPPTLLLTPGQHRRPSGMRGMPATGSQARQNRCQPGAWSAPGWQPGKTERTDMKKTIKKEAFHPALLGLALATCMTGAGVPVVLAAPAPLATRAAALPAAILIQLRPNTALTAPLVYAFDRAAGVPLRVTRNLGAGSYLLHPLRSESALAMQQIVRRLQMNPSVQIASLYQPAAPQYVVSPNGQSITLNPATLQKNTVPIRQYRWQQFLGPRVSLAMNRKTAQLTFATPPTIKRNDASSTSPTGTPPARRPTAPA